MNPILSHSLDFENYPNTPLKEINIQKESSFPKKKFTNSKQKRKRESLSEQQIQLEQKQKKYVELINVIRVSFNMNLYLQYNKQIQIYKVYVGKGNNGGLVKNCFRQRYWWHVTEDKNGDYNMFWSQSRNDSIIENVRKSNYTRINSITVNGNKKSGDTITKE